MRRAGVGEIFLEAAAIQARVEELGRDIASDYAGSDLLLVGLLKSGTVFLADLSRAVEVPHAIDFVELAGYDAAASDGRPSVQVVADLSTDVRDRDALVVEDVVDTGLTLNYLCKLLEEREPRSLAVATLLDRPYRRLVEDLPIRYTGFVVPDEYFVGYGFGLDTHGRNLPDLRLHKV